MHAGFLRALQPGLPTSSISCANDDDCDRSFQYCADGQCLAFGFCGTAADCENPSNIYSVIFCEGPLSCNGGSCSRECNTPSSCSNDDDCDRTFQYCADGQCLSFGSCAAVEDCENPSNIFTTIGCEGTLKCDHGTCNKECATTPCATNDDCDGTHQYCANGECLGFGFCATDNDCHNPSNMYSHINCEGPLSCVDGFCNKACAGNGCPKGDRVECLAEPCAMTRCGEEFSTCVNDYCGGCNAIFLNEQGKRVCAPDSSASCMTDSDCSIGREYCSEGICRDYGTCGSIVDCQNPSNQYNINLCAGYLTCQEGFCAQVCAENTCPPGSTVATCMVEPCNSLECNEPYDHCVNDYCNGCKAVFINASGSHVCKDKDLCKNDDTCKGKRGFMRRFGCKMREMSKKRVCH